MSIRKTISNNSFLYPILRPCYHIVLVVTDFFRSYFYKLSPNSGIRRYQDMQETAYKKYTKNFDDSKNLCVGSFEVHEQYPYDEYLLEHYSGNSKAALDFACGMGRMMNRMQKYFEKVDGVDLSQENLDHARNFLKGKGISDNKFSLFKSDGIGVKVINKKYDFIYSTIALQHICVHSIRLEIFKDLYHLLNDDGSCCFQMGYGWDNGLNWFENNYVARSTNAGSDVAIPNSYHLEDISKEFASIGYKNIQYEFKITPHPELGNKYHPIWIFIHMEK